MSDRTVRVPGPDHPITITPTAGRVVVTAGGVEVADSTDALTLQEANYPPVQYVPMDDVRDGHLTRTATTTWCPFKGEAGYYALPSGVEAVWEYATPHDAVAQIKGHVAFYPDRVDSIVIS